MKKQELYYLAGYFDGEGCISIHKYTFKNNRRGTVHQLFVYLTNRTKDVLDNCHKEFGGQLRLTSDSRKNSNRQPCYEWRVSERQAGEFLKILSPFLRQKLPQARLALNFRKLFNPKFRGGLPECIRNQRDTIFYEMKELNKRGL